MIKKHISIISCLLFCMYIQVYSQSVSQNSTSDIDLIKKRVVSNLIAQNINEKHIESIVNTIKPNGTWPDINYEDVSREGFQHSDHYDNMVAMAVAYNKKGSQFYKSRKIKNAITSSLRNWVENDYICDNWWYNEIGTPSSLVNLMLLIGNELPKELVDGAQLIIKRAHVDGPGARPGGDRIKITVYFGLIGFFVKFGAK